MFIEKIILEGYVNLYASGTKRIEITPHSQTLLILGSNGSGKTSLVREYSVLPPNPNRFDVNGFKQVICHHNNKSFKLTSTMKNKNFVHSFIVVENGVEIELNADTKVTTQRRLCEEYFSYNQNIHEVLTFGTTVFTTMSNEERRVWLTRCCPIDYTYVNSLFKKVKESVRDMTGTIKHLQNKDSDIQQKLLSLDVDEEEDVIKTLDNLILQLESFTPFINGMNDITPTHILENEIEVRIKSLEAAEAQWKRFEKLYVPSPMVKDKTSLMAHIARLEASLDNLDRTCNSHIEKLMNLTKMCDSLEDGSVNTDQLISRLSQINKMLEGKESKFVDHQDKIRRIQFLEDEYVSTLLPSLRECNREITVDEVENARLQLFDLKRKQIALTDQKDTLERKIRHLEAEGETATCPRCSLNFSLKGNTPLEEAGILKKNLSAIDDRLNKLEEVLNKKEEEVSAINESSSTVNRVKSFLTHNSHIFDPKVINWEKIKEYPNFVSTYCSDLITAITNDLNIYNLLMEKKNLERSLAIREQIGSDPSKHMSDLEKTIDGIKEEMKDIKGELTYCTRIQKMVNHFETVDKRTNEVLHQLADLYKEYTKAVIRDHARSHSNELQMRIGRIKEVARQKSQYLRMQEEVKKDLESMVSDREIDNILMECLSPKTGVSADQLSLFIKSFVATMNSHIRNLWTTPFEIHPCNMDNGTLTCQFPFTVSDNFVTDISSGSKGQRELVNLVFVITLRHFLGLQDFPLFLDELGDAFDHEHRKKYMRYAKSLLDDGLCSQMLIINHYNEVSQTLHHHDTIVLDERNIIVPAKYNETTVIVKGEEYV